jgi:hypothetical protein
LFISRSLQQGSKRSALSLSIYSSHHCKVEQALICQPREGGIHVVSISISIASLLEMNHVLNPRSPTLSANDSCVSSRYSVDSGGDDANSSFHSRPMFPLLLLVSSFTLLVAKNSFVFFNACPSSNLQFLYGSDPSSLSDDGASGMTSGYSIVRSVSYSPVYYQILDANHHLFVAATLTISNENMNGIGYVSYPKIGCQHFQYAPTDATLSSHSVVVYVNGADTDKAVYVATDYQGQVLAQPNSYLEIPDPSEIIYSETYIQFCNGSCVSTSPGSATIPIGSAIFFVNYFLNNISTTSAVLAAGTGSTSISYWCDDCDLGLDFDDDFGVSDGVIAGAVIGSVLGCCLLCGIGYLVYFYCMKKKNPEDPTVRPALYTLKS